MYLHCYQNFQTEPVYEIRTSPVWNLLQFHFILSLSREAICDFKVQTKFHINVFARAIFTYTLPSWNFWQHAALAYFVHW